MLVYFVLFVKNILKQTNKSHLINKKQVKKIVLNKDKIKHNYVKMSVEYGKLKPTIESRLTHKHISALKVFNNLLLNIFSSPFFK